MGLWCAGAAGGCPGLALPRARQSQSSGGQPSKTTEKGHQDQKPRDDLQVSCIHRLMMSYSFSILFSDSASKAPQPEPAAPDMSFGFASSPGLQIMFAGARVAKTALEQWHMSHLRTVGTTIRDAPRTINFFSHWFFIKYLMSFSKYSICDPSINTSWCYDNVTIFFGTKYQSIDSKNFFLHETILLRYYLLPWCERKDLENFSLHVTTLSRYFSCLQISEQDLWSFPWLYYDRATIFFLAQKSC